MASPRFDRFLVVKLADLGDAVLALPAVQALRATYRRARIDVLTTPVGAQVFWMSPVVDDVLVLDKGRYDRLLQVFDPRGALPLLRLGLRLRTRRYDAVLLLHHLTLPFGRLKYRALLRAAGVPVRAGLDNGTGSFLTHTVPDRGFGVVPEWRYALDVLQTVGVVASGEPPRIVVSEDARDRARTLLQGHGMDRPLVVVHPGVGPYGPGRAWPAVRFRSLASVLIEHGFTVAVTGTAGERTFADPVSSLPGVLDLVGKTSVATLAAVLERAQLVVGADSGVLHLASAVGARTLAVFGPSNVQAWAPYGSVVLQAGKLPPAGAERVALHAGLPCSPCFYVGYRLGRPNGCDRRTCLEAVTPDAVARVALAMLDVPRGTV